MPTNSAPTAILKKNNYRNQTTPSAWCVCGSCFHSDLHLESICFTNSQIKSQLKAVQKYDWPQSILYCYACLHLCFDYWCVVADYYSKDASSLFSVQGLLIGHSQKSWWLCTFISQFDFETSFFVGHTMFIICTGLRIPIDCLRENRNKMLWGSQGKERNLVRLGELYGRSIISARSWRNRRVLTEYNKGWF